MINYRGTVICALPGRVDVARHFILTGGSEGLKEDYLVFYFYSQT